MLSMEDHQRGKARVIRAEQRAMTALFTVRKPVEVLTLMQQKNA